MLGHAHCSGGVHSTRRRSGHRVGVHTSTSEGWCPSATCIRCSTQCSEELAGGHRAACADGEGAVGTSVGRCVHSESGRHPDALAGIEAAGRMERVGAGCCIAHHGLADRVEEVAAEHQGSAGRSIIPANGRGNGVVHFDQGTCDGGVRVRPEVVRGLAGAQVDRTTADREADQVDHRVRAYGPGTSGRGQLGLGQRVGTGQGHSDVLALRIADDIGVGHHVEELQASRSDHCTGWQRRHGQCGPRGHRCAFADVVAAGERGAARLWHGWAGGR